MINGVRDWNNNKPANTNLCFSNSKVIEIIANSVAEYSAAHPELSHVAVWLASPADVETIIKL